MDHRISFTLVSIVLYFKITSYLSRNQTLEFKNALSIPTSIKNQSTSVLLSKAQKSFSLSSCEKLKTGGYYNRGIWALNNATIGFYSCTQKKIIYRKFFFTQKFHFVKN